MATEPDTGGTAAGVLRKLAVPAAVSAAAGAAGLAMTRRRNVRDAIPKLREGAREAVPKVREAASDLPRPSMPSGGVGELTDDLRGKLDSVLGRDGGDSEATDVGSFDASELEERRRAREQRRSERRRRSRS